MGDFDKNQVPNASAEKKKLIFVGVLGAVLLGVLGFHFMKGGGPQSASASALNLGAALPAAALPTETPAQARAALENDPTVSLLRGTISAEVSVEKAPHNPFVIASEWQNSLVRPVAKTPQHTVVPVLPVTPQGVHLEGLKLTGIFQDGKNLCAIVNGQMLFVGMTLDENKVVEITHDHVTLQRTEFPNGPTAELTIQRNLQ